MKLISWNVNGLRAILKKNFVADFTQLDPDVLCLQETKLQEGQVDFAPEGYHVYWNSAVKKGYSGTSIISKQAPLSVSADIGLEEHDQEGRVLCAEYEKFYLVCVYTPNSKEGLLRLDYRMVWEDEFKAYLKNLEKVKPVVVCGDLNVAHTPIDLKNPNSNHRNAGFTDEERQKFTDLLASGFVDSFRYLHPDATERYSWWSYRFNARANNAGWRIDYFLVSDSIKNAIKDADILDTIEGSDHCPVVLELDLDMIA